MVQDRYIVSVKVQKEIVCMLLNGYVADDFGWPLTTQIILFYTFGFVLSVAIMGDDRNFKFGIDIDHNKS